MNTALVEHVVSQACVYSPQATLIVTTQPNELMTYVAWRASRLPSERVIGLGASVVTSHAHRDILNRTGDARGRVNGFFVFGGESLDQPCATVSARHVTIGGIRDSNDYADRSSIDSPSRSRKPWDLIEKLQKNETLYSNIQRRPPIASDVASRQKLAAHYLLSNAPSSRVDPTTEQPLPVRLKSRSNWTESMLIVRIIQALIDGHEFQSNFAVNIAPIHPSKNVFITYPTIIGSSHRGIEYMFPFRDAHRRLHHRSFLVAYEKLQGKVCLSKSED